MVKINGKDINIEENLTFKEYLEREGYNLSRVALELNGDILPKSEFDKTIIRDGDQVEIVCFVGGG